MNDGSMPRASDIRKRDDGEANHQKGQSRKHDIQSRGREPSEIVHSMMFSLGARHHK